MKERLLERIRRVESGGGGDPGLVDSRALLNSVQKHLMLLLNTEKGSVPIDDDYGVPDFFSLLGVGDVEALSRLERMLEEVVVKYEPRLRNVAIEVVNRDERGVNLHLQLSASLPLDDEENLAVSFDTVIDSGGRIRIE